VGVCFGQGSREVGGEEAEESCLRQGWEGWGWAGARGGEVGAQPGWGNGEGVFLKDGGGYLGVDGGVDCHSLLIELFPEPWTLMAWLAG